MESTIAAASAEIDAVKRQGRIQLDESTVDLRKNLGVAEEALQVEMFACFAPPPLPHVERCSVVADAWPMFK